MLQILLHSSKTMKQSDDHQPLGVPVFMHEAEELVSLWQDVPSKSIAKLMKVSEKKAKEVQDVYQSWSDNKSQQTPAIDAFCGDIYSGLQVDSWPDEDRHYAHRHLLILSGLYGALRACDGIMPYRLEMGYKLPSGKSMYEFWGDKLSSTVDSQTSTIINLSAVEYTKAMLPHTAKPVVAPKFLTISPKSGEPTFVTVHAKIARGAFASWLIRKRIRYIKQLPEFDNLGYNYNQTLSTPSEPVYVCKTFQGLGLSVRRN